MSAASDLSNLIAGIRDNPGDRARLLVAADFLDEHFPATPVEHHTLPAGFHRHWSRAGCSKHKGYRFSVGGPWSNADIVNEFLYWRILGGPDSSGFRDNLKWFDHGGSTVIGGHPVLVGEPYSNEEQVLSVCDVLAEFFRCPVTFSRVAFHQEHCVRLAVWFTFSTVDVSKPARGRSRRAPASSAPPA